MSDPSCFHIHADKNELRRAYNRTEYREHRHKLMCCWSEHIANVSTGNISIAGLIRLKVIMDKFPR